MSKRMKVLEVPHPGGPEALIVGTRPIPDLPEHHALIQVSAAGINRADLNLRSGKSKPAHPSGIPGLEISGRVIEVRGTGSPVWQPKVGDRVCALVSGGGYAQYAAAPLEQCLPVPKGYDDYEAAALPEAAFTVWDNLYQLAQLRMGQSLLIHGGSSGIGNLAIQVAKMTGAFVIATAGSEEKCQVCLDLGADAAINYRNNDFAERVQKDYGGVDVVFDIVGAPYLTSNIQALRYGGTLLMVGSQGGREAILSIGSVMEKRLRLTGSVLKTRSPLAKGALAAEVYRSLWPRYEKRQIKTLLHSIVPMSQAHEAHRRMERGEQWGKSVIDMLV